jgi:hypothetical protein
MQALSFCGLGSAEVAPCRFSGISRFTDWWLGRWRRTHAHRKYKSPRIFYDDHAADLADQYERLPTQLHDHGPPACATLNGCRGNDVRLKPPG